VGRFVEKKGFDKVLGAADENYKIIFAGGEAPLACDKPNMIFWGNMNRIDLSRAYQIADIFLLPSEDEGFPLSIQEAMASGLPVITSKDDGYKRYALDENRMCFLEKPTSDSIRLAIKRILADEILMGQMSAYSIEYMTGNFAWPVIIEKLVKIYSEVKANKK